MQRTVVRAAALAALALWLVPGVAAHAEATDEDILQLKRELEELRRRDAERDAELEALKRKVETLEDEQGTAEPADAPATEPAPTEERAEEPSRPWYERPTWYRPEGDLWSRSIGAGDARLRLMDISLDVLASVGGSTADQDQLLILQDGEHDPKNQGFNLQQVELGFQGAVDPYVRGDAYLVFFIDGDGESQFELEEAFLTSMYLPFGISDAGFQIEGGTFFTDFGRINAQHPHYWHWQDQPFVWTRIFGGDGMRGPGVAGSWLMPLPWYSDLKLTAQNANGETQASFLANSEFCEERAIGGRPCVNDEVDQLKDLNYTVRWANGFDLTPSWSAQAGVSGSFGPNASGGSARTWIWGADAVVKWRPEETDRGWPFVILQGEYAERIFEAEALAAVLPDATGASVSYLLPRETLRDRGFYAYALYGFVRRWAAGFRLGWGNGSGDSVAGNTPISVSEDPYRAQRWRLSPLVIFHPSEFMRLRLQYNYDITSAPLDTGSGQAHTVWFGVEFGLGAHPAHAY